MQQAYKEQASHPEDPHAVCFVSEIQFKQKQQKNEFSLPLFKIAIVS